MVVVPYVNSLNNPFIWDDSNAIVDNPTIRSLWPLWGPLQPPCETPVSTRPLVNLSFALNYSLHGLRVQGYHLVNLGLHLLTACLLFAIVHRALTTGMSNTRSQFQASLTALLATLVWAVHPMLSEVVNYTTQRSDALGGLFLVATVFAAQRALGAIHRTRWHVIAAIACVCGVLSKEFVAVTPLIVILYDRVFAFRSFREAFAVRRNLYGALAATWIRPWRDPRAATSFDHRLFRWCRPLDVRAEPGRDHRPLSAPGCLARRSGTRLWRSAAHCRWAPYG